MYGILGGIKGATCREGLDRKNKQLSVRWAVRELELFRKKFELFVYHVVRRTIPIKLVNSIYFSFKLVTLNESVFLLPLAVLLQHMTATQSIFDYQFFSY